MIAEVIRDAYAGTGRAVYRLLVGAVPFAGELYPMVLPRGQLAAIELRGARSRMIASSPSGPGPKSVRTTSRPSGLKGKSGKALNCMLVGRPDSQRQRTGRKDRDWRGRAGAIHGHRRGRRISPPAGPAAPDSWQGRER